MIGRGGRGNGKGSTRPAARAMNHGLSLTSTVPPDDSTAPLLLTASSNAYWPRSLNDYTPSLPVFIFNDAVSPYEDWHRQAWAAAFVLVATVMVFNIGVRLLAGKRVIVASQAD